MTEPISEDNYLEHYGIKRRSGRYPYGSGGEQKTYAWSGEATELKRAQKFKDILAVFRKQGMSDTEIARGLGLTTTELRATISIANQVQKNEDAITVARLRATGMSPAAISKETGIPDSTVRDLLKPGAQNKADKKEATAQMLREQVKAKTFIDVGTGNELHMNVSRNTLDTAVAMLRSEGYELHPVLVNQLGTKAGQQTKFKVLCPPGTTYKDLVTQKDKIRQVTDYTDDDGKSWSTILPPLNISQSRVKVRFAEDGGSAEDGVIYVRPGVKDLSLGKARYAQVRIQIDGTHFLKGMAFYKDDLPAGTDLVFNTNKPRGTPIKGPKENSVMKPVKDDPENPFGSIVRQIGDREYPDGPIKKLTSAVNLVNEEGDWDKWSRSLAPQVLSKQPLELTKKLLDERYENKRKEYEEINSLTNPAVKRKLLESFADDADASAVHMKAERMKGQRTQVLLPLNSLKETEIYAPNFESGTRVALIRYPHGGTFEIPELTVNNNHRPAKKLLADAADAVAINSKVAARLSGADFDGDTVLVIPQGSTKKTRLKTTPPLEKLKGFEPTIYRLPPGVKSDIDTQKAMGDISNLISDMTIKGAPEREIAQAVRHSMVVIDAEKHNLDHRKSAEDNGIVNLKRKYQLRESDGKPGGASTLISRAKSRVDVRKRSQSYTIDTVTGEKVYKITGREYIDKHGRKKVETQRSTKLAETKDAHTLSSGTAIEKLYADHSNRMKALGNEARLSFVNTPTRLQNKEAKKVYAAEARSLAAKVDVAKYNRPRERQAQVFANAQVELKRQANPDMDASQLKKIEALALESSRSRVGAKKTLVEITDREWDAIQAGAISNTVLNDILNNADLEKIKMRALPRESTVMNASKLQRAQLMLAAGRTQAEVASALGVSLTTLKNELRK